jgi:FKBP12-rapamycin complex-associated protein
LPVDDRNESRRYAAALVFRELARTAPFSINDRIESILDYLWTALRDPKVNIREVAASALSGCLKIASGRDTATRNECYAMVFEQAQRGFRINTGDAIHGSLLGYKELFTNGNMVCVPQ